ncbi:MAG TPA: hypothetical protein VFO36_09015 [Nitrospiraceae bacterium]|nr:hypothetical protein [Nitrospiraceae bacterium]
MKGRRLLDGTLREFPPSVLDAMRHGLDWSWAPLADRFETEDSASAARLELANIIVGLAEHGATDPAEMARQAIDLFLVSEKR